MRLFGSSLADKRQNTKGNYMKKVKFGRTSLDKNGIVTSTGRGPLTAKERKSLLKLAARPDSEINFSDIPEIKELPPDYMIGRFYRPKKETISIRLDADVLAWLKQSGEGYQTRINTYLRQLMHGRQSKR
jgi:uncharacterized protein (DUF4415 family)